jgi:hypothetical protein
MDTANTGKPCESWWCRQRIDDPHGLVLTNATALLGEEGVLRIVAADDGDDFRLGRVVDLGDSRCGPWR